MVALAWFRVLLSLSVCTLKWVICFCKVLKGLRVHVSQHDICSVLDSGCSFHSMKGIAPWSQVLFVGIGIFLFYYFVYKGALPACISV